MQNKVVHIVCLDAPAPPDYGGAIDMFYKVKALSEIGHDIILHYFSYHPLRHTETLKPYCKAIYAYTRKSIFQSLPLSSPFIVQSRINQELISRLNEDNYPMILEGLHCSGIVPFLKKQERIIIRMHNDEASYYHHLSKAEKKSFFKKMYYCWESRLLHRYQKRFNKNIKIASLSETDVDTFNTTYQLPHGTFIPCFIPWQTITCKEGRGNYCLYHGNLSIPENEEAAWWLIRDIFSNIKASLVIAGKDISKQLMQVTKKLPNITFVNNPSMEEIHRLVAEAHIHVLPSLNHTGVKLKLLNALLNGRFCITNTNGVIGSRIESGVIVEDQPKKWTAIIDRLMQTHFTPADKEERWNVLSLYNNRENAEKLSALWKHYQ